MIEYSGIDFKKITRIQPKHTLDDIVKILRTLHNNGEDLTIKNQKNKELKRIYYYNASHFGSWWDLLKKAGIDPRPYTTTKWKNGNTVIEFLREQYPAGIVYGPTKNQILATAISQYFGSVGRAVESAGLVHAKNGVLTEKELKDPKKLAIIYKHNKVYIHDIADKVYYNSWFRIRSRIDRQDLESEAFLIFLDILKKKPKKPDIREYAQPLIEKGLKQYIRKNFRDARFHEGVFFDPINPGNTNSSKIEDEYIERLDEGESLKEHT